MKAISLWQPWASLWCSPAKIHETRSWPTDYRGWLAVHAAKKVVKVDGDLAEIVDRHCGRMLPYGAFVGIVYLDHCLPTELVIREYLRLGKPQDDLVCGDFAPGRWAWRRGHFRQFQAPVPWRGRQGLFTVPDHVVAQS